MESSKITAYNNALLKKLSIFLNFEADAVTPEIIDDLMINFKLPVETAFSIALAAVIGLDTQNSTSDRELYEMYFSQMIHCLDSRDFIKDPYYSGIVFPSEKLGKWEFRMQTYKPYEAFVYNDMIKLPDGRIIPQIGFFRKSFEYPAVLENGLEWMMVTPEETLTMKNAMDAASGNVLTFGLGLGYYPYIVSAKPDVSSVTVVERDKDVIALFTEKLLPQFPFRSKINIICSDAFEYAAAEMAGGHFNYIFTDIWRDAGDGLPLYEKMKTFEYLSPESKFSYWIEPTIKCYQ